MSDEAFHVKQFPELREKFLRDGFGVVTGVFDTELMDTLEARLSVEPKRCTEVFKLHPTVLAVARSLVGEAVIGTGEERVSLDKMDETWHFTAPYKPEHDVIPIWRFAVYFPDYVAYSGGLGVVAGSHRGEPQEMGYVLPVTVRSRPGDLVVWNIRTYHRHNMKNGLRPFATTRAAIYFDYGAPGAELDHFVAWKRKQRLRPRAEIKPAPPARSNVIYPNVPQWRVKP